MPLLNSINRTITHTHELSYGHITYIFHAINFSISLPVSTIYRAAQFYDKATKKVENKTPDTERELRELGEECIK